MMMILKWMPLHITHPPTY